MTRWRTPDARGWIGIGVFSLVVAVLAMLWLVPELRKDEFFKTIATLIVGAFIKDVVAWAYSATKGGGELAASNAAIVAASASPAAPAGQPGPTGTPDDPVHVIPEERS